MKSSRHSNLHLAGIDILLPALVCINGRSAGRRHTSLIIGFAKKYDDSIIAPLVGEWLWHLLHRQFVENCRGPDGDLAAEVFYDKLAYDFADDDPFVSALVVSGEKILDVSGDTTGLPRRLARTRNAELGEERALARFIHGAKFARWNFSGMVRAHLGTDARMAQISFEDLPGGIALTRTGTSVLSLPKTLADMHDVSAWYGFGVPLRNPADAVVELRNEIAALRRPEAGTRGAPHVTAAHAARL
jgi:hypothetical protein